MANNRQNLPIDERFRAMNDPNINEHPIVPIQMQQPPFYSKDQVQNRNLDTGGRNMQREDPQYYPQDLNGQFANQQMPHDSRFEHASFDPSVGRTDHSFSSGPPIMQNPLMMLRNPTPPPRPPNRENKYDCLLKNSSGMSKAKRFIFRLKTELLPPRHPSAVIGRLI
jgi:hypothetical protein